MLSMQSLDSFKCRRTLQAGGKSYEYYSLKAAEENGLDGISALPASLKVLLENLLRYEDGRTVTRDDILAMAAWLTNDGTSQHEIAFRPARVLMQDFTGVPAIVDLAAMRDAMSKLGGDPEKINPLAPVDLVIDHSVMVDFFGTSSAFHRNVEMEYKRNLERYTFLKWGQMAFDNFRVVPPGTGICHQVNLEYLARTVWSAEQSSNGSKLEFAFPDTLVGTDSHTTMVNGLSVLGWGVGGIEAEAAMLGQPISMVIPDVVGFRMTGKLPEGATATDLVLTVTEMLREKGVVGKFVEFYGPGLVNLTVEDQATIGNMSPEYGATCGFFPVTAETLKYLEATGRPAELVELVGGYARAQGTFNTPDTPEPMFTDTLSLDLGTVEPSVAGPKRPQDRVAVGALADSFAHHMDKEFGKPGELGRRFPVAGANYDLGHGDIVVAAITSCTNTSNPSVMIGAGLLARNANRLGLKVKPYVKTSLAPGSQVVTDYLNVRRPAAGARQARLRPRRLRLHDMHRQFRAAGRRDLGGHPRQRHRRLLGACRATATSRAASSPTCRPTIWPRRRWSSLTRSPARSTSISLPNRSAKAATASLSTSRTSGRAARKSPNSPARTSPASPSSRATRTCSRATTNGAPST
jgi:aconitate hydratase